MPEPVAGPPPEVGSAPGGAARTKTAEAGAADTTGADAAAPRPGLRARKKAATMHHVQSIALDLFDRYGFDAVSIEQVAQAAEVSASTVYRYFGTKEGLVVLDEYDDRVQTVFAYCLSHGDGLLDSVERALDDVWGEGPLVVDTRMTTARTRLCFEVPAVRAALSLLVDEQVEAFAAIMAESGRWSLPEARILASAAVWAVVAALRNWYEEGCTTDVREAFDAVLPVLAALDAAASRR